MQLKTLSLSNFRNYQSLNFEFDSSVTVLVGDNAQGKSSFLESIYFLSTTKSPKAWKDEDLITQGQTVCRVEGKVVQEGTSEIDLEIAMTNLELFNKRVKVNGISRRVLDYLGNLIAVLFAPEDINLVTGTPSLRRWHIDMTLALIDKEYKKALTQYGEVVTKRNRLLKNIQEGQAKIDELDFWSQQLLEQGQIISAKRQEFFSYLNKTERKFGEYELALQVSELSLSRLQEYQSREIASAMSLIGPHRDDFAFFLNGKNLAKFGSRGENRTAVLDLKVAEAQFIEHKKGVRPILLLDDVFSELDLLHRQHVLDLVTLQQTIIAAVELDDYLSVFFEENGRIFKVENGQVKHAVF